MFILELFKVWADVIVGIAWPFIAFVAIRSFSLPIKDAIARIRSADFSGGGARFFLDSFQRVVESKATPEEKKQVRVKSVVSSGENANGSYTLYSNLTIVVKLKAELKAMSSSCSFTFPIVMANEVISVQIVGDLVGSVTSLSTSGLVIKFDPVPTARSIQIIVAGL